MNDSDIGRLHGVLPQQFGHRFFLLYGPGLGDTFITPGYLALDFEQILARRLREIGIARTMFFLPSIRRPYFRDHASHLATRRAIGQEEGASKSAGIPRLGASAPAAILPPKETDAGMGDVRMTKILDGFMHDEAQRSTIVFKDVEHSLRTFDARRQLYGRINEWNGLGPDNRNFTVWLFAHDTEQELAQAIDHLQVPVLKPFVRHAFRVGTPDVWEMRRLIDYARLKYGVRVSDWAQLDSLAQMMSQEGLKASQWLLALQNLGVIDDQKLRRQELLSNLIPMPLELRRVPRSNENAPEDEEKKKRP